MHLIIQTLDGKTIDTSDILTLSTFKPSQPMRDSVFQQIDGRKGALLVTNELAPRSVEVEGFFLARDLSDFILQRDELYQLFDSEDPFFIIDSRQSFKRWKVTCDSFESKFLYSRYGEVKITFNAFEGMAESTGTTQTPFSFDADAWGIGQNMVSDDLVYTFNSRRFRVYNAGDFEVDPREKPLTITFKGASENLEIRNATTGEIWQYNGTTNPYDTITLDRVYVRKNATSVFNNTNRKTITLVKGWNDFVINGASSAFELAFDFRFYYK